MMGVGKKLVLLASLVCVLFVIIGCRFSSQQDQNKTVVTPSQPSPKSSFKGEAKPWSTGDNLKLKSLLGDIKPDGIPRGVKKVKLDKNRTGLIFVSSACILLYSFDKGRIGDILAGIARKGAYAFSVLRRKNGRWALAVYYHANKFGSQELVLYEFTKGKFAEIVSFKKGVPYYAAIASGDLDGDGDDDLALTGRSKDWHKDFICSYYVKLFTKNPVLIRLGQGVAGDIAIHDMNGDKKLDIVCSGVKEYPLTREKGSKLKYDTIVFYNNKKFQRKVISSSWGGSLLIGDFNADGVSDIFISNVRGKSGKSVLITKKDGKYNEKSFDCYVCDGIIIRPKGKSDMIVGLIDDNKGNKTIRPSFGALCFAAKNNIRRIPIQTDLKSTLFDDIYSVAPDCIAVRGASGGKIIILQCVSSANSSSGNKGRP